MSDLKPRRGAHAPGHSETAPTEATPSDTVPSIASEAPAAPQAVAAPRFVVRQPVPAPEPESVESVAAAADHVWDALTEVQAAFARGFAEAAIEMTGMTRSGVAAAADAAVAMLGVRTLAEAVEINTGLARRGADAVIEGSARLSEIGVAAMTEATRPILSRLGTSWSGAN